MTLAILFFAGTWHTLHAQHSYMRIYAAALTSN